MFNRVFNTFSDFDVCCFCLALPWVTHFGNHHYTHLSSESLWLADFLVHRTHTQHWYGTQYWAAGLYGNGEIIRMAWYGANKKKHNSFWTLKPAVCQTHLNSCLIFMLSYSVAGRCWWLRQHWPPWCRHLWLQGGNGWQTERCRLVLQHGGLSMSP